MSRDWNEAKELATYVINQGVNNGREMSSIVLEAIAEIEQLRQEKAELVEVLKGYIPPIGEIGWWCSACKEMVNGAQVTFSEHHEACGTYLGDCQSEDWDEKARKLLAKLEGGEPK